MLVAAAHVAHRVYNPGFEGFYNQAWVLD